MDAATIDAPDAISYATATRRLRLGAICLDRLAVSAAQ